MLSDHSLYMASAAVTLHPLVLLSIGDHSARSRAQNTPERRAGVLFGTQVGRDVEIIDTSPMNIKEMASTDLDVDHDDLQSCIQLHKAVYSTHEVLGWYAFGDSASLPEFSRKIQQEMEIYNESPLFLYFTIGTEQQLSSLPVTIYKFSQQDKKQIFSEVAFSIVTKEAETLTVDYLSNQFVTRGANPLALHLRSLSRSVGIMASRINVLIQYLLSQHDDPDILRSVKSICDSLPVADLSSLFQSAFIGELNDSLLIAECASITRASESVQRLLSKCRVAFDDNYEQRKRRAYI